MSSSAPGSPLSASLLLLDPAIRNWVLLPIFAVMFLQGVLRHYIGLLLKDEKKPTLDAIARASLMRRSQKLRANAAFIPLTAFNMRKRWMTEKAYVTESIDDAGGDATQSSSQSPSTPPPAAAQDPLAMVGMMKQNLANIVPQMLLMGWVSYFFSGFVLGKLPFGVTHRFKQMLQRGLMLTSLDVSYVTSLSWYVLTLFGMKGLFMVALGSDGGAIDQTELMAQQMQMQSGGMPGAPGQPVEHKKMFEGERNELEIVKHEFAIAHAEQRITQLPVTVA